jgi:outer membrane protein OmpA-like peptidoglycan-associated protein
MPVILLKERNSKMLKRWTPGSLLSTAAILLATATLVGCVGECPVELKNADKAIADARAAGKDKDCPEQFKAAERLKIAAFEMCQHCDSAKAKAIANEALAKTAALCPPRPTPVPAPVAVVVPPAIPPVTVTLAATPASIKEGECSTLAWTTANAASASIDQGVGSVELTGSKKVCPTTTTSYAIAAVGAGGTGNASTTVNVKARVLDRLTLHVNFDFDKYNLDKKDEAELEKGRDFLKKYPGYKISLEGHTDSIGTDAYNQKLSERRANAVKAWLVGKGIDAGRITTAGFGKTKPVADNKTKAGRAENRRVEVLVLSE